MGRIEVSPTSEYYLSDVAQHTNETNGYWMAIDHQVYDLTKFMSRHPGGPVILEMHVGLDATTEFIRVGHDIDNTVLLMMKRYRIGKLVTPYFPDKEDQKRYSNWSKTLSLCTEMLNAFSLDISIRNKDLIPDVESKEAINPINVKLMSDLLVRFKKEYLLILLNRLSSCMEEDYLKQKIQLIIEKIQVELQIHEHHTTTPKSYQQVFQKLITNQNVLKALKEELVKVNKIWEQNSKNNTPPDFKSQLVSKEKLVAILTI